MGTSGDYEDISCRHSMMSEGGCPEPPTLPRPPGGPLGPAGTNITKPSFIHKSCNLILLGLFKVCSFKFFFFSVIYEDVYLGWVTLQKEISFYCMYSLYCAKK